MSYLMERIRYFQEMKYQLLPMNMLEKNKKRTYFGQMNKLGNTCSIRNCIFEPSQPDKDWINSCLKEIENAFMWKKPAVISTHRVNYIGSLNESNRVRGLKSF